MSKDASGEAYTGRLPRYVQGEVLQIIAMVEPGDRLLRPAAPG